MLLKIAIPTGRLFNRSWNLLREIDSSLPELDELSRKLVWRGNVFEIYLVKPWDIPVYVEEKITEIGIVGGDVIRERKSNVVIMGRFRFGYCKMVLASYPEWDIKSKESVKVASKYPKVSEEYFNNKWKGIDYEIVKLNGSVELAPIANIADCIIDLVETGNTLRENGLEIKDVIFETSAMLIINEVSFAFKKDEVLDLIAKMEEAENDQSD